MHNLDQDIREKAYHLWMADGCRDGNADGYWLAAQRDLLASSLPAPTHAPAAPTSNATTGKTKFSAKEAKTSAATRKTKRRAA